MTNGGDGAGIEGMDGTVLTRRGDMSSITCEPDVWEDVEATIEWLS